MQKFAPKLQEFHIFDSNFTSSLPAWPFEELTIFKIDRSRSLVRKLRSNVTISENSTISCQLPENFFDCPVSNYMFACLR
jgi:hypothetical protein